MTLRIGAGRPATATDREAAKGVRALKADELTRIRAGALAWRNGLGALLAGLVGFGLIKGRSDVGQLSPGWAVLVGALLLAALIAGGIGGWLLMRAAHGRPYASTMPKAVGADLADAARRAESDASENALQWGVVAAFTCMGLLAAAVGFTWYGPEKKQSVEVQLTSGARHCGQIVSLEQNRLTLKTSRGQVVVDVTGANGLAVVDSCAATPSK